MAANFAVFGYFKIAIFNISESILLILVKFGTQVALIGNFKVNISVFGKIQFGHQFCCLHLFLNYDLQYLRIYSTDFSEICHKSSTYREL